MPAERSKSKDYEPLSSSPKSGESTSRDQRSLRPSPVRKNGAATPVDNLKNPGKPVEKIPFVQVAETDAKASAEFVRSSKNDADRAIPTSPIVPAEPAVEPKKDRKSKKEEKDRQLLNDDRWYARNGHSMTYFGLYLFSIFVLFRPYELISGLSFLSATTFYIAIVTLVIFVPNQLATEGNLTIFSTEVKAILVLTLIALVTVPIAKDPGMAWDKFIDPYIKAVLIFVVLVNVVRTRKRLMGLMWLSFAIAVYLSFSALQLYMEGKLAVEGYRVEVNVGGMFGNPNEMALHFVMMTPLVLTLGIASKSKIMRLIYFAMAVLFVGANMVTFSRGGFLGLVACSGVLAWKLGRKYRLSVTIASIVIGGIAIIAAPGNYGLRMLSIFVPGLDPVGSSDQRMELLKRSLLVTARNPWGIGIGNFSIVGVRNLQSHNAYTQVSTELGILGLAAYLVFIISPFRKLGAIERTRFAKGELDWFYYFAIGLQASIVGYMVSSFFASVAYNWFIYYLIAYAVAFRRIYGVENGLTEDIKADPLWERQPA